MKPFKAVGIMEPGNTKQGVRVLVLALSLIGAYILFLTFSTQPAGNPVHNQAVRKQLHAQCKALRAPAGPPPTFNPTSRIPKGSDRHVPGTPSVLIRNAKIWTGARNGTEIVYGDVLVEKGLITAVGYIPSARLNLARAGSNGVLATFDADGRWITPGLVDLHSHLGVNSAPVLAGTRDGNSRKAPIQPWLRSVDGLNTHDAAYELSIAGGVTTAQVLPGSANNIGGQAYVIKLRPTSERSTSSKVVEPPQLLFTDYNQTDYYNWRHMKHACGENPDRLYGQSRMDGAWNFRNAYNEAKKIKDAQDAFCDKVEAGAWQELDGKDFPEDLQWESLVDVLRGRVKLSIHCYEAVDLDAIVRLSNEFKFPVASFHHAGETYLVPKLLKKTWGGTPTIALFASNFRKKREAYRGSEFAPKILADHGIPVVMKSDHPVMNSRYLLFEAQQAHYYGLHAALALASVTSTPARAAGLGHRIGTIAEGFDADLVIWDSHPLALGATPIQVYIDGIAQLTDPKLLSKPSGFQELPETPNWDAEAEAAVKWDGLPPLKGTVKGKRIKFTGVRSILSRHSSGEIVALHDDDQADKIVYVEDGFISCIGDTTKPCNTFEEAEFLAVDLQGGALAPGLTTFGSPLGLIEIRLEPSTNDGTIADPLIGRDPPSIIGDDGIVRALDGLQFEGRNTLLAYRSGVTEAITAPVGSGFISGLSTVFRVGAAHALDRGAIVQEETAFHISVNPASEASVSTQIAALRNQLFGDAKGAWALVREGKIPLVVNVDSADIMATLIGLKSEYEERTGYHIQLTFVGASEAHLLAKEIGQAGVSVVLTSSRPYPGLWESRRIMPGPPISRDSALTTLLAQNVQVGVGVKDESAARNTRFEIAWAALESNGTISKFQAIKLATSNLERALGVKKHFTTLPDLVVYRGGGILDFNSKVLGVVSARRGTVELF